jgi:hypothetical protein
MRPPVWLLGALLVGLAIFGLVEMTNRPAAIPYGIFLDQVDAGNVASVTFEGTQIAGRFRHPVAENASNGTASQVVFRSRIPDFGDQMLLPELRKQHATIDVLTSSNWLAWLGRLPWPMVLFMAVILVAGFVRLVRGGKPSGGSDMPMHPMQGMLGLIPGLFGKKDPGASPSTGGTAAPPSA